MRQGFPVVADSVNPIGVTREAWHAVAREAQVRHVDIEVVCSDPAEHRRRATARTADIPGHRLPTWNDIATREYEPWVGERIVLDTAAEDAASYVVRLRTLLA